MGISNAARSVPDGYTLAWSNGGFAAATMLMKDFPFDPVRDGRPVAMLATSNNVLVGAMTVEDGTVKELVEQSRVAPGTMLYGWRGSCGTSVGAGP
jgi:tripartite-type tricarboxylate transporter receptor subunit TctC